MKTPGKIIFNLALIVLILFALNTCKVPDQEQEEEEIIKEDDGTWDIDKKGIPKFVTLNYIQLDKIYRISRFRSGIGHSYSDDFETCRSMKHYFSPKGEVEWGAVKIYSPVAGKVTRNKEGWAGNQITIQSDRNPAFYFILFHVKLSGDLPVDTLVKAGQALGTHVGTQTMSDIAVGVDTPGGWKLISFFNVMTDSLFQIYRDRGADTRDEFIISKSARDGDHLVCDGEDFENEGNLDNWVILN